MAKDRETRLRALEQQSEQRRLSREQFLTPKIREEEVPIAGLGGSILIRSVSHSVRRRLREEATPTDPETGLAVYDDDLFTRLFVVESIVDPELTHDDVEALEKQSATVFDQIIMALTIFGAGDAVVEAKKDSPTSQSSDTPSDSVSASGTP